MSLNYPKLNLPSAKSQPNSEFLPNSSTLPNKSAIQPNNSTIFPNSAQLPNTLARQQFSSQFTSPPFQMGPTQKFHSNFEKSNTIALTKLMQQQTMRNENPEILIDFSVPSGQNGAPGYCGRNAGPSANGTDGTFGQKGKDGTSVPHCYVSLSADGQYLFIKASNGFVRRLGLTDPENSLKLRANGGRGGDGGIGGDGGSGGDGHPGISADRYRSGTDGGPGGNGGCGGNGGDAGNGGDGGDITINLQADDMDLAMIYQTYQAVGVAGGIGGSGGHGGRAGSGGPGGKSYSWSETVAKGDSYTTEWHHMPGGNRGPNGMVGMDGTAGRNGIPGRDGKFEIEVNFGEKGKNSYPDKFWVQIISFDVKPSEDEVFEPKEIIDVENLLVENVGKMHTPLTRDIPVVLMENKWLKFDRNDAAVLDHFIEPSKTTVASPFPFVLNENTQIAEDWIWNQIVEIIPKCLMPRLNKDFGITSKKYIQIRYPVELSPIIGARSISFQEESPFAYELRNISTLTVGVGTDLPRVLYVTIQQCQLYSNDRLDDKILESEMVPLEYCSENRQRFLLNLNPITNDYTLNGKESVKFGGTFRPEH